MNRGWIFSKATVCLDCAHRRPADADWSHNHNFDCNHKLFNLLAMPSMHTVLPPAKCDTELQEQNFTKSVFKTIFYKHYQKISYEWHKLQCKFNILSILLHCFFLTFPTAHSGLVVLSGILNIYSAITVGFYQSGKGLHIFLAVMNVPSGWDFP